MSQSTVIVAFLAAAFLIFITQRGSLRTYLGFLFGNVSAASNASASPNTAADSGGSGADYATALETGAEILAAI